MKLRSTVSVGALAGKADRGRFFRDVLRAPFEDEPRVFEPLDWQEFRKDFAIICEQLVR